MEITDRSHEYMQSLAEALAEALGADPETIEITYLNY